MSNTTVKVKCVGCKKQISLSIPERKKGETYNILTVIGRHLPEGWTKSSDGYRCEECS